MSGMGSPDEGALHAVILSENEQHRIRSMLAAQRDRISRHMCAAGLNQSAVVISQSRDVLWCLDVNTVCRVKMLTKMQ